MRFTRLLLLLSCFAPALLHAQILYWDTNGAAAGGADASGTWNATTAHWSTSSSLNVGTGTWSNGATAYFGYASGQSIWFEDPLTVGGITLSSSRPGISFSGPGVLTFSPDAQVVNATNIDFGLVIGGSATPGTTAFTLTNIYDVSFTQANTFTGQLLVNGGDIFITNASALGATGVGNETHFTNGGGQFLFIDAPMTLNEGFIFSGYRYVSTNNNAVDLAGPILLSGGGNMGQWYGDNLTISGVISETGGAGMFTAYATVTGANTFTGTLEAGRLTISNFNNAGVAGPLGMGNSVQLGYDYEGPASGELVYTGGSASSNRGVELFHDSTIRVTSSSTALTLTGVIAKDTDPLASTSPDLTKAGPGALVLRGNNTYNGTTRLLDGALILGHNNALGTATDVVRIGDGSASSNSLSLLLEGGVTLARDIDVFDDNSSGTTTLGVGSGIGTFSGTVFLERDINVTAPAASELRFTGLVHDDIEVDPIITKTGAGRVVFSGGVDLAAGGFTVQQGELRLNATNNLAYGISVQSGATLSGTGTINIGPGYTAVMQGGSVLQPGSQGTGGTITFGSLEMMSGSRIGWELLVMSTTPGTFDRVVVNTGAGQSLVITSGAQITVDLSLLAISQRPLNSSPALNDPFWQVVQTWQVVDFTGTGTNALSPGALNPLSVTNPAAYPGGTFDTFVGGGGGEFAAFSSGDVYLRFTPVPEPSTYALLGLGGALLGLRRWRRRI